jgi:hypothetical protein
MSHTHTHTHTHTHAHTHTHTHTRTHTHTHTHTPRTHNTLSLLPSSSPSSLLLHPRCLTVTTRALLFLSFVGCRRDCQACVPDHRDRIRPSLRRQRHPLQRGSPRCRRHTHPPRPTWCRNFNRRSCSWTVLGTRDGDRKTCARLSSCVHPPARCHHCALCGSVADHPTRPGSRAVHCARGSAVGG